MKKKIRVGLVDDERLIREGLRLLVEQFPDLEVVLEAENGQAMFEQLEQQPYPDVLLLDLRMPVMDGIAASKRLAAVYPEIKVVVLSTFFSKTFVLNMLDLGVAAYLPKNAEPAEIEVTINEVAKMGFYYSKEVMGIIRKNFSRGRKVDKASFGVTLSGRELEILQLICEQHTTAEIAKKLFISPRTVDGHRNNMLQKLNCRNTAGLVAYGIQKELVKIDPTGFW